MKGRLSSLVGLFLVGCTQRVEIEQVRAGTDFRGLSSHERREFEWAAIDVDVPEAVARSIRRWELSNVSLKIFRCGDPANAYPAAATVRGALFDLHALREPLGDPVTLTFHLPKHVYERERYGCAALDARGYSPVFLHSQTVRLPMLRFHSFREKS